MLMTLPVILWLVTVFALGLGAGSFIGQAVYRLPFEKIGLLADEIALHVVPHAASDVRQHSRHRLSAFAGQMPALRADLLVEVHVGRTRHRPRLRRPVPHRNPAAIDGRPGLPQAVVQHAGPEIPVSRYAESVAAAESLGVLGGALPADLPALHRVADRRRASHHPDDDHVSRHGRRASSSACSCRGRGRAMPDKCRSAAAFRCGSCRITKARFCTANRCGRPSARRQRGRRPAVGNSGC